MEKMLEGLLGSKAGQKLLSKMAKDNIPKFAALVSSALKQRNRKAKLGKNQALTLHFSTVEIGGNDYTLVTEMVTTRESKKFISEPYTEPVTLENFINEIIKNCIYFSFIFLR